MHWSYLTHRIWSHRIWYYYSAYQIFIATGMISMYYGYTTTKTNSIDPNFTPDGKSLHNNKFIISTAKPFGDKLPASYLVKDELKPSSNGLSSSKPSSGANLLLQIRFIWEENSISRGGPVEVILKASLSTSSALLFWRDSRLLTPSMKCKWGGLRPDELLCLWLKFLRGYWVFFFVFVLLPTPLVSVLPCRRLLKRPCVSRPDVQRVQRRRTFEYLALPLLMV